ncbi:MAG TPA: glycosyltransferase family 4 protein [Longimicrobiaceae bacterium]|nr:glycosyltransferase family 4 protein [Longimicrobiaceae bacterium]
MPGPAEALIPAAGGACRGEDRAHVLFLAKQFPWPTNVGARQRSFHVARGLARTHEVTVAALDDPPPPEAQRAFLAASGCARVLFVPPSTCRGMQPVGAPAPRLVRALRAVRGLVRSPLPDALLYWWSDALVSELAKVRRERHVDVVFASQSWMAEHARAAGFERIVVDVDDLLSVISRQQLRQRGWYPRKPLDVLRAAQERAYERSLPLRFTRVLVAKDEDRRFFPAAVRERVAVLPNGVSVPDAPAPAPERADTLLFVGTLGYPPNVDAVTWFAREVLPLVWEARPDVRFQVAGFGSGAHLAPVLADSRCAVAESPPELAPFYAAAAVVVTPVRTGGGTRIKILEALAHGKALVSTRFGPEGLSLRGGVDLEFADTPRAMADSCLALLGDPVRRRVLGTAGRAHVAERFDWRRIEERLDSLLPLPGP